ncbi:MAG TPA: murein L,D-transpeptidase catalytic domain family protein [Gemmatirosa sp.]
MLRRNARHLGQQLATLSLGAVAALGIVAARFIPEHQRTGPVVTAAASLVGGSGVLPARRTGTDSAAMRPASLLTTEVASALGALASGVRQTSHPQALEDAFRSYFAYHAAHPDTKPYLYFVDYGLPSTTPRGYVFDMAALRVVDGPFAVAHGRGSSETQYGVPTRFSNASGSEATSLGLYVAQELYAFRGHAGGGTYNSVGLRLAGVSDGFNENARARRVVAHGAPYVTETKAGRSEGCPALEPSRAERLLPKLANGGLVFLFAPDPAWMTGDPWLTARAG